MRRRRSRCCNVALTALGQTRELGCFAPMALRTALNARWISHQRVGPVSPQVSGPGPLARWRVGDIGSTKPNGRLADVGPLLCERCGVASVTLVAPRRPLRYCANKFIRTGSKRNKRSALVTWRDLVAGAFTS
jgi:hypothetical protein